MLEAAAAAALAAATVAWVVRRSHPKAVLQSSADAGVRGAAGDGDIGRQLLHEARKHEELAIDARRRANATAYGAFNQFLNRFKARAPARRACAPLRPRSAVPGRAPPSRSCCPRSCIDTASALSCNVARALQRDVSDACGEWLYSRRGRPRA